MNTILSLLLLLAQAGTPPPASLATDAETFVIRTDVPGFTNPISTAGHLSMSVRKVGMEYRFNLGAEFLKESSSFVTDYWPTRCNMGPAHTIYVAGKGFAADTVVFEVWRFTPPVYQPGRLTVHGQTPPRIKPAKRTSVTRIAEVPSAEGYVRGLVVLRNAPTESFLVLYSGSSKLYAVDAATGVQTLVASPTPTPGVLHEPLLATPWEHCYVARRTGEGFLYLFRTGGDDFADFDQPSLMVIRDTDENGSLDSSQGLSYSDWQTLGYGNANGWVRDYYY